MINVLVVIFCILPAYNYKNTSIVPSEKKSRKIAISPTKIVRNAYPLLHYYSKRDNRYNFLVNEPSIHRLIHHKNKHVKIFDKSSDASCMPKIKQASYIESFYTRTQQLTDSYTRKSRENNFMIYKLSVESSIKKCLVERDVSQPLS